MYKIICLLTVITIVVTGCKPKNIFYQSKNIQNEKHAVYIAFDSSVFARSAFWGGKAPLLDFQYYDSRTHNYATIPVSKTKQTKIYIENPVFLHLDPYAYMLSPRNSYLIKMNSETGDIYITGKNKAAFTETNFQDNFLFITKQKTNKRMAVSRTYIDTSMSAEQIRQMYAKVLQSAQELNSYKQSVFDSLSNVIKPSTAFLQTAKNKFLSDFSGEYYWLLSNREVLVKKNIYEEMIRNFINKRINTMTDEEVFYNRSTLEDILTHGLFYNRNNNPDFSNLQTEEVIIEQLDMVANYFTGAAKDYLIGFSINRLIERDSKYLEQNRHRYLSKIKNKFIRKNLQRKYYAYKTGALANDILYDINENEHNFNNVLKGYQGTLLLVDVWASWCAPCLQENKYLDTLKETLKNEKIKFLHLSTDKTASSWKKSVVNYGNNQAVHFRLSNHARFKKQLDIKTIPRFILYDDKGAIIDDSAPFPSDNDKLYKLIKQHL